jgi:hypothetical protein
MFVMIAAAIADKNYGRRRARTDRRAAASSGRD